MKNNFRISVISSLALVAILFTSCVKKEYDAPFTVNTDPNLSVSKTIRELTTGVGTTPTLITTNEVISGIVTADDLSGNFYKEIIIEDSSGAIAVEIDKTNYNTLYPIGRRLFIKCEGLYIADDGDGNFQIGVKVDNTIGRIPSGLAAQYIAPGQWGLDVSPETVSLATLINNPNAVPSQSLVRITNVEFDPADTSQPYANASTQQSMNRIVKDCSGNDIQLYTSGFADFASHLTPTGKGSVVAIFKLYNGAGELAIRNLEDIVMTDPRCGSGGSGNPINRIDSLRYYYPGSDVTIPANSVINGVVISDYTTANITSQNMVIQDLTAGIVIRFTTPNTTFALNDSVQVNISGYTLTQFQGLLEVNNVLQSSVVVLGTGSITPMVVTASQVNSNLEDYESRLVQVTNATLAGSGTYSGSVDINDATGTLILYTRTGATFSGLSYPTGTVTVTGYITDFNGTAEMTIRNSTDVQ